MAEPATIRATFSQYAMVKTRGVLVLHMEVPLEQQAEVFATLGYPLPGAEVWCGIARLTPGAGAEPGHALGNPPESQKAFAAADEHGGAGGRTVGSIPAAGAIFTASECGKARYAAASDMERARTRAALLAKDVRFMDWIDADYSADATGATRYIQDTCCAGESRRLIAEDRDCYEAFLRMETTYMIETNQMAEPR